MMTNITASLSSVVQQQTSSSFSHLSILSVAQPKVVVSGRAKRVTEFSNALLQVLGEKAPSHQLPKLEHLNKLFSLITKERDESVKSALVKSEGYLVRFFSSESWEEWTENRTSLGKVVSLFIDHEMAPSSATSLVKMLDAKTIRQANREAKRWNKAKAIQLDYQKQNPLSSCIHGIFLGVISSSFLNSLSSMSLSLMNCLPQIMAQPGRNPSVSAANRARNAREQILANRDQIRTQALNKPHTTNANNGQFLPLPTIYDEEFQKAKRDVLSEIEGWIPKGLKKVLENSNSWYSYIIEGVKSVLLDLTGMTAANDELKQKLADMEDYYWMSIVYPHYRDIFPRPNEAWDGYGRIDHSYSINIMREKLKSHGYHRGHGTPLQFIQSLKDRGVCEVPFDSCQ